MTREPTSVASPPPDPPAHLSGQPAQFWRDVVAAYALSPSELTLLELACDALATSLAARDIVLAEGVVAETSAGTFKASAAERVARDARLDFARLLRQLDLAELPEEALR